jgi:hypothetical protein
MRHAFNCAQALILSKSKSMLWGQLEWQICHFFTQRTLARDDAAHSIIRNVESSTAQYSIIIVVDAQKSVTELWG